MRHMIWIQIHPKACGIGVHSSSDFVRDDICQPVPIRYGICLLFLYWHRTICNTRTHVYFVFCPKRCGTHRVSNICPFCFNSLRPSDAIWRQWSWTTLAQVMACCLTAPSHYLNQCWLIIRGVLWHSSENSFTGIAQGIDSGYEFEKDILKNIFKSPRGQWVKHVGDWHRNLWRDQCVSSWCKSGYFSYRFKYARSVA